MINQQPNATEITGNMSPNFWKFNNVSPNGVFGNKVYGDDLKRIWEFVAMVVVHGGKSGGDMVVSGGLKGVFGSLDPRILTTPSSSSKALTNVYHHKGDKATTLGEAI
ncbi:hypothetical protein Tco_0695103 [Tanacetum coccineum]